MRYLTRAVQGPVEHRLTSALSHLPTRSIVAASTCLFATHRHASSNNDDNINGGSRRSEMVVDAVARPMGYGPFSATAKTRVLREKAAADHRRQTGDSSATATAAARTASTPTGLHTSVMHNVTLQTNLSLRLSLAGLPHPSQLRDWAYMSAEWRLAFIRLYRAILRLHNKTVAVSLHTARGEGPEAAVMAVTGVQKTQDGSAVAADVKEHDVNVAAKTADDSEADDYLLRYLLTPEQQEFGNRFVQGEFQRHMDADAVSAAIFYSSWYDYVLQLASGVTSREMTEKEKRLLSDEQKEKLNALRGAFVDLRVSKAPHYVP